VAKIDELLWFYFFFIIIIAGMHMSVCVCVCAYLFNIFWAEKLYKLYGAFGEF